MLCALLLWSCDLGEGDSYGTDARLTFAGYDCVDDCSGHEAGYEWAESQGIDDPEDCGGNSESFIEGCIVYAQEQAEAYAADDY